MKKLFIALALTAFCTTFVQAQDFRYGVKAGLNLSAQSSDVHSENLKHPFAIGGNGAIFGEYFLNQDMSLAAELQYSLQGRHDKYPEKHGNYVYTQLTHYINVPVLFNYYLVDGKLDLQAGPQFGFCLGGKEIVKYKTGNASGNSNTKMVKDAYNVFDFAIVAGANWFFTDNFFVGARYQFGITNSLNAYRLQTHAFEPFNSKNRIITVNVGYRF